MIDLEGIPQPEDAPEPGSCVRLERRPDEEGLVHLILDPPHRPKIAVLDVPLLRDLDAAVTELERTDKLKGLVITGRDPLTFAAGADVNTIARPVEWIVATAARRWSPPAASSSRRKTPWRARRPMRSSSSPIEGASGRQQRTQASTSSSSSERPATRGPGGQASTPEAGMRKKRGQVVNRSCSVTTT